MSDTAKRKTYRITFLQNAVWLLAGLSIACAVTIGAEQAGGSADSTNSNPALGDWKPFTEPSRGFDPKANLDLVPDAEFAIGKDSYGPIVRVNMLKIADWPVVPGIRKVWKAHYKTPGQGDNFSNLILSEVVDVDGRNRFHAFCYINWSTAIARYDDKGACLWVSDKLPLRAGDESRLPVLDIDADGTLEVLSTQKYPKEGGGGIVCLDGDTGKVKWLKKFEGGINKVMENPMAVGHFSDTKKFDIVARFDKVVYCLDSQGTLRWKHQLTDKYDYGHELYWYDVDGDGIDEFFVSTDIQMTAFRGDGTIMWQDKTSRRHSDFIGCGDVDADGRIEVVYDHDGCGGNGPIYIADALTGKVESTIDYNSAGLNHAQGGVVGKFRSDIPGLQIFLNEKINGICMFDNKGNLLWKNDAAGSLASSGDWDGDGDLEAMCFALGTNRDGIFSVWDGHGKRKYAISFLPSPLYAPGISHAGPAGRIGRLLQTDMTGDDKADVVMSFGRWGYSPDQYLLIMGEPEDDLARFAGQYDANRGKAMFENREVSPGNTTYYVDAAGDDRKPGTAPDTAWRTLTHINALKLAPGDKVLLKAGCEFAGLLALQGSGAEGKPIVIDKYGPGANPVINGEGKVENTIRLHNQHHWKISNLTITNTDGGGWNDEGRAIRRAVYVTAEDVGDIEHIHLQNLEIHDVRGMYRFKGNETNGGIICKVTGNATKTRFVDLRIEGCTFRTKSIDRYPVVVTSSWKKEPACEVVWKNNTLDHAGRAHIVLPADQWPRKLVYYFDPEVRKVFSLEKTATPVSPFTGRLGCEDVMSEIAARLIRAWHFYEPTRLRDGEWLFKHSPTHREYSLFSGVYALGTFGELRCMGFIPPWDEDDNSILKNWIVAMNSHIDPKDNLLKGPSGPEAPHGSVVSKAGYVSNGYAWQLRNRVFMAGSYVPPVGSTTTEDFLRDRETAIEWLNAHRMHSSWITRVIKTHVDILVSQGLKPNHDGMLEFAHEWLESIQHPKHGYWANSGINAGLFKIMISYQRYAWPINRKKEIIDYVMGHTRGGRFHGSGCSLFDPMHVLAELRLTGFDYRSDDIDDAIANSALTIIDNWDEKTNWWKGNNWGGKHNFGAPLFLAQLLLDQPYMKISTIYNWREGPIITRGKDGTIRRNKVTYQTKGFPFGG